MCGVAGIVALTDAASQPRRGELLRMVSALAHRGPDATGVVIRGRAGLAHTRLSIIDLSGGAQPMADDTGRVLVSYNGEVFDYVELRDELVALGHTFHTQSDTEVVLHAYLEWGESAFGRLNGQFAIAIWDGRRDELVLARDPHGIRPLYVCAHAGRLYFASEVKAIFAADPSIRRALDPLGIDQTLTFWTVVAPRTALVGVEELESGHVRIYGQGQSRDRSYATPQFAEVDDPRTFGGSIEDAIVDVRDRLARATELQMLRADVRVGAYLSGGLDSSLVAALAQRAVSSKLATFSLRFDDAEYDEGKYQRLVSRELGTDHHELVVRSSDIADVFPRVIAHAERPILRTAPAPLFLLSRLVQQAGIKVVLTGEGADEVFGGYDLFREAKVRRFWARHPASCFRPRLLERLYPYLARSPAKARAIAVQFFGRDLGNASLPGFGHDPRWRTTSALKRLLSRDMREAARSYDARAALLGDAPERMHHWSALAQDQWLEMRTLLASYILSAQGDRMLMAHSIEGRFPFLDREVVALANMLPAAYKLHVLDEKHVLKRASIGLVPPEVVRRTKQPYRAPDAFSFVGPDAPDWVSDLLEERAVLRAGVFDPTGVRKVLSKCRAASSTRRLSNSDNMALVGIISTLLVHETFIDHPAARSVATDHAARMTEIAT